MNYYNFFKYAEDEQIKTEILFIQFGFRVVFHRPARNSGAPMRDRQFCGNWNDVASASHLR